MSERTDEWECRSAGEHGEGPYSIERGGRGDHDEPLQKAATGIMSYPLACAIEGIANGLDEFMDLCPTPTGIAPQTEVTDEMEAAGAKAIGEQGGIEWPNLSTFARAKAKRDARACLSAALTQKEQG